MKCGKARKRISLHLTGDLDYRQGEEVKEHLITCDTCAEEAESYRQSLKALGMLKSRTMPALFWDGYMEELRERIRASKAEPARSGSIRGLYAAAAVAAVLVIAVAAAWLWHSGAFNTPAQVPPTRSIAAGPEGPHTPIADVFEARTSAGDKANLHFASDKVDVILETAHNGDF
jgi:anti-sigma factor RsiW